MAADLCRRLTALAHDGDTTACNWQAVASELAAREWQGYDAALKALSALVRTATCCFATTATLDAKLDVAASERDEAAIERAERRLGHARQELATSCRAVELGLKVMLGLDPHGRFTRQARESMSPAHLGAGASSGYDELIRAAKAIVRGHRAQP
jgi:hypothetical protein